jgi:hypothetical protein
MNPPTTHNIRTVAISGNRPTTSLCSYEEQGRSFQNKEATTYYYYLEAVQ